jgi:hypothetical protein
MKQDTVDYLIKNPADYDYRYTTILKTLPAKENMKQWVKSYEFSDFETHSESVDRRISDWGNISHNNLKEPISNVVLQVVESNMLFFITSHSIDATLGLLGTWADAVVITFINHIKFQKLSHKSKSAGRILDNANECANKYNMLRGIDWPVWEEFQETGYNINNLTRNYPLDILNEIEQLYPTFQNDQVIFDIDSCIFKEDKFLSSINTLYRELGLGDFNENLVKQYYRKYIALHM